MQMANTNKKYLYKQRYIKSKGMIPNQKAPKVSIHRSMVTTGSSSSTEEDVVSKQSDSQETPVPKNLYTYIEKALVLEKQLETNINDKDLESKLSYVMHRMGIIARLHKANNDLPSDWEYNSDTARLCVPAPNPTFKMKITEKRRRRNPHNDSAPFTNPKVWREFKDRDKATKLNGLPCPIDEEIKNPLGKENDFVRLICGFAVGVFNDSYHMYVNKDNTKNVSNARIMDCFYLKVEDWYIFFMTIEATEQGNPGVYEITVRCNTEDGAITLDSFVLKNDEYSGTRKGTKFSQRSTYEKVQDGWSDPQVYYESSGMVRRRPWCGGYDYSNPFGYNSWVG